MVAHDLVASLARARQWVRDEPTRKGSYREVTVEMFGGYARCALHENTPFKPRLTVAEAETGNELDGGEHYDDPAAELAHAIDAALERAEEVIG